MANHTDEELASLMAKPQLDGAPSPALHMRLKIMFGPVITTEAHLAHAGAILHSNNTAELWNVVEALSFLGPHGPVAPDSQACIFHDSRHAASICLGTVQSRANVSLGLTCQRVLLQIQLRLRFTVQHIYSHAQNSWNECADRAAALGTFGPASSRNIRTRWTHSSFDSTSLFAPCDNLDDALQVSRNAKVAHLRAPQRLVRS